MKTLQILALTPLLVSLTACFQTTTPLCTPANVTDLPGLEGSYEVRTYDEQKFETQKTSFSIRHTGTGAYSIENSPMTVCQVGGKYLAQTDSKEGHYEFQWLRPSQDGGSIALASLAADLKTLQKLGVPYSIIDTQKPRALEALGLGDSDQKPKALLIDNSRVTGDVLVQNLDTMSLDVTLWRVK